VWRLQTEDGNATAVHAFSWDTEGSSGVIVNLSVWSDVEHLAEFVFGELHRQVLRNLSTLLGHVLGWFIGLGWFPALVG